MASDPQIYDPIVRFVSGVLSVLYVAAIVAVKYTFGLPNLVCGALLILGFPMNLVFSFLVVRVLKKRRGQG